ncbi:MAG: tRNA pseudouridine(38-40) synthase TruA [Bacteroidetes bacterium]|nr:tRNA pseudouridine(38-40) synthase TruA [Bacteroidota bacterium]
MARYKLILEYEGTRYSGWQYQKDAKSIQGELAKAVIKSTGVKDFELMGSGRTDAGVHALAQVAHLDIDTNVIPQNFLYGINAHLPTDIHALSIQKVPDSFHARHSAEARSYVYQISMRRSAFGKKLVWWVKDPLNIAVMQESAAPLIGLHDFRSFASKDAEGHSTKVKLEKVQIEVSGSLILIRLVASHFLHKMVRQLVGSLVEIGRGKWRPESLAEFLKKPGPEPATVTAPPSGLFLERVYYPGDHRLTILKPVLSI